MSGADGYGVDNVTGASLEDLASLRRVVCVVLDAFDEAVERAKVEQRAEPQAESEWTA